MASDGNSCSPDNYQTWRIQVDEGASAIEGHEDITVQRLTWSLFPNPANPSATIVYELHRPATVRLSVFNLAGQLVKTLIGGERKAAGTYEVTWNGRDSGGQEVATGVYLYRLEAGEFSETKRMVLIEFRGRLAT